MALVKVAEITVASTTEPLPGKIITLQNPVVEIPSAMTPKIRISVSGSSDTIKVEENSERICGSG